MLPVFFLLFLECFFNAAYGAGGHNTKVTLPGGKLTLIGAVTSSGCLLSMSNSDKKISIGIISSNQFAGVGSDGQAVPFSIQLDDCSSNVSQSVGISFSGVTDRNDSRVLAIESIDGSAQGIGVALFDKDNNLLEVNPSSGYYTVLNNGMNTLNFLAKYRMTSEKFAPGYANSFVDFTLTYE